MKRKNPPTNKPKVLGQGSSFNGQSAHTRNSFTSNKSFVGRAYQGKDIVFRFIIEYSSLRDFGP
jgi:hypothetical protein